MFKLTKVLFKCRGKSLGMWCHIGDKLQKSPVLHETNLLSLINPSLAHVYFSFFLKKQNILISQLLHRPIHIAVPYYKHKHCSPRKLKHKVLVQSEQKKSFQTRHLKSNSFTKSPTVTCKHLHRGCLNIPVSHLHHLAIILLL